MLDTPQFIITPGFRLTAMTARDDRDAYAGTTLDVLGGFRDIATMRDYGFALKPVLGRPGVAIDLVRTYDLPPTGTIILPDGATLVIPLGTSVILWAPEPTGDRRWHRRQLLTNINHTKVFGLTAGTGGRGIHSRVSLNALNWDTRPPSDAIHTREPLPPLPCLSVEDVDRLHREAKPVPTKRGRIAKDKVGRYPIVDDTPPERPAPLWTPGA